MRSHLVGFSKTVLASVLYPYLFLPIFVPFFLLYIKSVCLLVTLSMINISRSTYVILTCLKESVNGLNWHQRWCRYNSGGAEKKWAPHQGILDHWKEPLTLLNTNLSIRFLCNLTQTRVIVMKVVRSVSAPRYLLSVVEFLLAISNWFIFENCIWILHGGSFDLKRFEMLVLRFMDYHIHISWVWNQSPVEHEFESNFMHDDGDMLYSRTQWSLCPGSCTLDTLIQMCTLDLFCARNWIHLYIMKWIPSI